MQAASSYATDEDGDEPASGSGDGLGAAGALAISPLQGGGSLAVRQAVVGHGGAGYELTARNAAEYLALRREYKGLETPLTGGQGRRRRDEGRLCLMLCQKYNGLDAERVGTEQPGHDAGVGHTRARGCGLPVR